MDKGSWVSIQELKPNVGECADVLRISRTAVDKDKDLATFLSESCIPVGYPFFKKHTSHIGILAASIRYQHCVHVNTFETWWFLALVNNEQFHLVLPRYVSAAQDCSMIHGLF